MSRVSARALALCIRGSYDGCPIAMTLAATSGFVGMLIALGATGCARSVRHVPDAAPDRVDVALDGTVDGAIDGPGDGFDAIEEGDAVDVPRVNTCSELHLGQVVARPGRTGLAYPGSVLTLGGTGFDAVLRVVIGGVEMPFDRASDASLSTSVPPMLAAGERTIIVETERCSSGATVMISRLIAVVRASDLHAQLFDATDLAPRGDVTLGSDAVVQAQFTLDGSSLVTRDVHGRVDRTQIASGTVQNLSLGTTDDFVLAQGTTLPTRAMLLLPGRLPPGLLQLDSVTPGVVQYPAPATDPSSLALSLDGFRALVLDADGALFRGDLPFAAVASWAPLPGWRAVSGARTVLIAQAPHAPSEHLAALFARTPSPWILPFDAITGTVGARGLLPDGVSRPRFVSGDVVVMDSTSPDVEAVDITDLTAVRWTVPLNAEPALGVLATRTATSLYTVGAIVLRERSTGVPTASALHVVDFHVEPPVETGLAAIDDLRGVVGLQGTGHPFITWTARSLVRVLGDTPDPGHWLRSDLRTGNEIELVAVQP